MLAGHGPALSTALERATAAGYNHLNLDGIVLCSDRAVAPGPNEADLGWSESTSITAGTCKSSPSRTAGRCEPSPVRLDREHDTTCARNRLATTLRVPTLTDLGYENAGNGFRHPFKKPQGAELGA